MDSMKLLLKRRPIATVLYAQPSHEKTYILTHMAVASQPMFYFIAK